MLLMNTRTTRKTPSRWLCALLLLAATAPLAAQGTIRMGTAEGDAGQRGIHVIITASHDVTLHGYSVAFTYPADVLTLTRVSTAGTDASALDPDFVGSTLDNQGGLGSMGVIFDLSDGAGVVELDPPAASATNIIARLTFDVNSGAEGGVYPLALVDGIGNPAKFNRLSHLGTSLVPELVDGEFIVSGTGNTVRLEKRQAIAGATPNLPIFASAQHSDPLDGFQIAFTYDKRALTLNDATYAGTALDFELGRSGLIELFSFEIKDDLDPIFNRATLAVLFDFNFPFDSQQLSPNPDAPENQTLIRYNFNVKDFADDERQWQELFMDEINVPGILTTRMIFGDRSVQPTLDHGKIYFSTGTLRGRVVDAKTGQALSGVSVKTSPDNLAVTTNGSGEYTFNNIPPGVYSLLLTSPIYYAARLDEVIVVGNSQTTQADDVSMHKVPPAVQRPFVRSFINDDETLDLSDPIFLLNFLFQGTETPQCLDAGDVNDDNALDISDGIFLLTFLFVEGGSEPPPPFSFDRSGCTLDPTPGPSPLGCEFFSCDD